MFPKRESYDNNYPELHLGQLDLLPDASPSRAPIWSCGTFSPYIVNSLYTCPPTHLSPYALVSLRTCLTVMSVYQPE